MKIFCKGNPIPQPDTWPRDDTSIKLDMVVQLSERLRTQDNRITAEPLFVVQQKKRIYGMDITIDDIPFVWVPHGDFEYACTDADVRAEIREDQLTNTLATEEDLVDIDPEDYCFEKVGYFEYWDFVCAHFTEKAAQRYIDENLHNLTDPRIYVSSQHRCKEWNAAREFLMGIR